jgi:hypothetical protein
MPNIENLKPFEKGHKKVGGRKKDSVNWSTAYNKFLSLKAPEQLLAEVRKLNPKAKKNFELLVVSTFNRALKGNPKAMEIIHHYSGGKPKDNIDITTQGEKVEGKVVVIKIPDNGRD